MPRIVAIGALVAALSLAAAGAGCRVTPGYAEAGTFKDKDMQEFKRTERDGVLMQIALYLPNRLMDMVDIAHVSFGTGVPLGFDLRLTKWAQLAASANFGFGVGWNGRDSLPAIYTASYTVAAGPLRTGTGAGHVLPIKPFELGVDLVPFKAAIDLAEIADFLLGWFFLDILADDWGWDEY